MRAPGPPRHIGRNPHHSTYRRNLAPRVSLWSLTITEGACMAGPVPAASEQASFLPAAATASPASLGGLIGLALRRPGGRRSVSLFTVLLLVAGVGMFAFPAATDLFGSFKQRHVKDQLADPGFQTLYKEHHVKIGEGLTRL